MTKCDVMLYALSTCGHCKDTKAFLGECGVNYDCIDVDQLDETERKKVIEEIIKRRRLPYSIELVDVQGDKFSVRNNFGSTIVYIKKGEDFILED